MSNDPGPSQPSPSPPLEDEDAKLYESFSGPRKKLKSATGVINSAQPGFLYTARARDQHIANLIANMRHYAAVRDDEKLAIILITLLVSDTQKTLSLKWRFRNAAAHDRFTEIVFTAFHLVHRHRTGIISSDALGRILRHTIPYQTSHISALGVNIKLAQLMIEQGKYTDCIDALKSFNVDDTDGGGSSSTIDDTSFLICRRTIYMMLALLRYQQWTEVMKQCSIETGSAFRAVNTVGGMYPGTKTTAPISWCPFDNIPRVWVRGGRRARSFFDETRKYLKKIVELDDLDSQHICDSVWISAMMMQLYLAEGATKEAMECVEKQCRKAMFDSDIHALHLAMLLMTMPGVEEMHADGKRMEEQVDGGGNHDNDNNNTRHQQQQQQQQQQTLNECIDACYCILRSNPLCTTAVQTLLDQYNAQKNIHAVSKHALEGLCSYLDASAPLLSLFMVEQGMSETAIPLDDVSVRLHIEAWKGVLTYLVAAAHNLIETEQKSRRAKHYLRSFQQHYHTTTGVDICVGGNTTTTTTADIIATQWQNDAADKMQSAHKDFIAAYKAWKHAEEILCQYAWWQQEWGHFGFLLTQDDDNDGPSSGTFQNTSSRVTSMLQFPHFAEIVALLVPVSAFQRNALHMKYIRSAHAVTTPTAFLKTSIQIPKIAFPNQNAMMEGSIQILHTASAVCQKVEDDVSQSTALLASACHSKELLGVNGGLYGNGNGNGGTSTAGITTTGEGGVTKYIPLGAGTIDHGPIHPLPDQWWLIFPFIRRQNRHSEKKECDTVPVDMPAMMHQGEDVPMRRVRFSLDGGE